MQEKKMREKIEGVENAGKENAGKDLTLTQHSASQFLLFSRNE